MLIIATHYNLYAYNLNKREFYSLLSHKGTIQFREVHNSTSLKNYCLLEDNTQYDISYDKEDIPFADKLPSNYINKVYCLFDIGVCFGSDRFNNWGALLTLKARKILFTSEELAEISRKKEEDDLFNS
ncbi:MAG: hypothetical protein LUH15_18595 [Tannerellaceae bacterium]|nr:hypothetical protein [Tannerellaceae bacterium]